MPRGFAVNEYDQVIIPRAQSMLRQGEALLHMGVARNDANLAGQVVLAAAIGVKIVPPMFFLVTTNQRLLAFKVKGLKFSGAPDTVIEDATAIEYGQARIARTGTTALGGQDLFFQTPQGEVRFSVVRSLSMTSGGGPTTQGQFFNGYPSWIQQQYASGFAHVGQTPTLEQVFQQMGQQKQQAAAQAQWQASRKTHPRRKTLGLLSWLAGLLMLPALIGLIYWYVEYDRIGGGRSTYRPYLPYEYDEAERYLAEFKAGTKEPYRTEPLAQTIARLEAKVAEGKKLAKAKVEEHEDEVAAAEIYMAVSAVGAAIALALLIALRVMASKVPRFADEDPKLSPGAPTGPGATPGPAPAA